MLFRFVEQKWWYFLFSGLLIVPGVIFLALGGLKPGIEFKGGTLLDIGFQNPPEATELYNVMAGLGHGEAQVQGTAGNRVSIRTVEMSVEEQGRVQSALEERYGENVIDVSPSSVS